MATLLQSANKANADLARHRHEQGPAWKLPSLQKRADDLLQGYLYHHDHASDVDHIDNLNVAIEALADPYTKRRDDEQNLADYMGLAASYAMIECNDAELHDKLIKQATSHYACRQSGRVLKDDSDKLIIAWDYKCGQSRYCPDESRQATKRLKNYYYKAMVNYCNNNPLNRIFYTVFTDFNFEPGELSRGKYYLIQRFRTWSRNLKYYAQNPGRRNAKNKNDLTEYAGAFCPTNFKNNISLKTKKKQIVYPPDSICLQGDLIVQEDPLSALGNWNVHLNVFLLIKGAFSYELARELWGRNVYFSQKNADGHTDDALNNALLEAMKYAVEIVPGKSAKHAEAGARAPSLIEWSYINFIEWYQAQLGFRRIRSTGYLHKIYQRQWDAETKTGRAKICHAAGIENLASYSWGNIYQPAQGLDVLAIERLKKYRNKIKTKLRDAMIFGEPTERGKCVGQIIFEDGAYRSVGSTLEHNFFRVPANEHNLWDDSG